MKSTLIEVCAGGFEDCLTADAAGIKRVELNSAMALGGLTCTAATLRKVKTHTKLEVICMVRPRGSGFCYDTPELEIMFEEARALLEAGADGIAFGMLEANGTIQKEEVKKMVDLIHAYGKTAVFHRAYDVSIDPYQSIETLIECGVDRLLTSGMEETAIQGMELIRQLQKRYGTKIEILPGGGINDQNIEPFLRYTGVRQIHSSCRSYRFDSTTKLGRVDFSMYPQEHSMDYEIVSTRKLQKLIDRIHNIYL